MEKTRTLKQSKSLLLLALSMCILGGQVGCAKKSGGNRNDPANRFGRDGGDSDEFCTSDGYFYDIPGYDSVVEVYPDDTNNSAGEFSLTPSGPEDQFSMRRTGTPSQFAGLTYISPNIVQTGSIIAGESAAVRILLYSTCSTESNPIYRVLTSGSQEVFALGQIPTGGSLTVTVDDPYRYDAVIVEYVGESALVGGQTGQIIPPLRSTVWSYGCLHSGGYCN